MDGAYVAVKFPGSMSSQSTAAPADPDPSSLLQDCRLLRIDELQVCFSTRLPTFREPWKQSHPFLH